VLVALVSIILVMGIGGRYLFNEQHVSGTSVPHTGAPSPPLQSSSGTVTPTLSPTPTPTPITKTVPENIPMQCASAKDFVGGDSPCQAIPIAVRLDNVTIDPSYGTQGRTTLNFTVTNDSPKPVIVTAGGFVAHVSLTDSTGTSIPVDRGSIFFENLNLGNNASLPDPLTFFLTPQPGAIYYLQITLQVEDGDATSYPNYPTYTTIKLTF
jgi:hypothetical protein